MTSITDVTTGRHLLDAIRTGALPPPPAAELLRLDLEVVAAITAVDGTLHVQALATCRIRQNS